MLSTRYPRALTNACGKCAEKIIPLFAAYPRRVGVLDECGVRICGGQRAGVKPEFLL